MGEKEVQNLVPHQEVADQGKKDLVTANQEELIRTQGSVSEKVRYRTRAGVQTSQDLVPRHKVNQRKQDLVPEQDARYKRSRPGIRAAGST